MDDICNVVYAIEKKDELNMLVKEKFEKTVFCTVKSARQSEFYQAQAIGLKAELQLIIRTVDLYDESFIDEDINFIKYKEKSYKILRTYNKNSDFTEVVCTSVAK